MWFTYLNSVHILDPTGLFRHRQGRDGAIPSRPALEPERGETVHQRPPEAGDVQPVKSAARTLAILEALAAGPERQSLGELRRRLDIPKSSLHALLRTMQAAGWVEDDGSGARFGLGLRALRVGTAYIDADDVVGITAPILDELAAEFDETVHLGRLDGHEVIYLAKRESRQPLRLFSAVGRRLPAYATALGKALLAEQPEDRLEDHHLPAELEALTANTITDVEHLMSVLEETRRHGYAIDHEESTVGLVCIAVALPLARPPVDAISCSVPTARLDEERERLIVDRLMDARRRLAARVPGSITGGSDANVKGSGRAPEP